MKNILLFTLALLSFKSYSQITFEKGYYYDNTNKKVECLIKNMGWLNNPTEFKYKLTENGNTKTATIDSINEFGVAELVYKRFTLEVSRSSQQIEKLSQNRDPEYNIETVFLKQLIHGVSNLYSYTDSNFTGFFFDTDKKNAEQLIFKKFLSSNYLVDKNNYYKQQLFNALKCNSIDYRTIENLKYIRKDLTNLFIKYNKCKGLVYAPKSKAEINGNGSININAKAGMTINSFKILSQNTANPSPYEFDFGSIIGYQFGAEVELTLPFNNNKWSIYTETTYNHFQSETPALNNFKETVTFTYNTAELSSGIRHYFFLNDTSKLFLGLSYVLIFDLNSEFTSQRPNFKFRRETSVALSLGYNFNNKYFIETRYDFNRGDLFPFSPFKTEFKTIALLLGVKIF